MIAMRAEGKNRPPMNRTKGFVNLNRFRSGRAIKRFTKTLHDKNEGKTERQKRIGKK
jgi:hypothetical protein